MRLEFEYTADDLREAMFTAQIAASRAGRMRYVYMALYFGGMFGYGELLSRIVVAEKNSKALMIVILPLIPVGLILAVLALTIYRESAGKTRKPWEAPARKSSPATSRWRRWRQIGILAILLAVFCGYAILNDKLSASAPDSGAFLDGALAVQTVLGLFGLWVLLTNHIRAHARVWRKQNHLHGPFRIDIDDQNMLISGTQWSSRLRWTAFQGFTETPNLIILYLSTGIFHMLPKRAIASPADLNELSRILVQHVQHGHLFPRPSAFPVNPVPAIPVETVEGMPG